MAGHSPPYTCLGTYRWMQFTGTYSDGRTRSQLLKGGSYYRPQGSEWCVAPSIQISL